MSDLDLKYARCSSEFTVELLEKLKASTSKGNIIVSPFSLQTCMALVFAGAKNETAKEISTALKYVSDCPTQVAQTFNAVLEQYRDSDLLKIANKLYIQEGMSLKAEYKAITKEQYHAEAEPIDFAKGAAAADIINKWVELKTAGKIKDVLTASALNANTSLVLCNALHFKGDWVLKFDETRTCEDTFFVGEEETVPVKYMNKKAKYLYSYNDDLKCKALAMPYKNSDLSMFALLPDEKLGVKDLLEQLKNVNLTELAEQLHEREVVVSFPKFKVEYEMEMKKVLQEMGVNAAFGHHADFSNMLDPAVPVSVSQVRHKACIEVNEEGSEAAAATVMRIQKRCAFRGPEFVADHPFVYMIWNGKTILFAGVFVRPDN